MLDDIIPVREKYSAPSPVPKREMSRSPSPATRNRAINARKPSSGPDQTIPGQEFTIDLTYSPDSVMIHRFIHFEIAAEDHQKVNNALKKYISLIEQDDQGALVYHQIQEQYEERMATGTIIFGSRDFAQQQKGQPAIGTLLRPEKQLSLQMVMDPDSLQAHAALRKQLASIRRNAERHDSDFPEDSRSITLSKREVDFMDKSPAQQIEKQLCKWVTQFLKLTGNQDKPGLVLHPPRFSEIRPMAFHRN